MGIPPVQILFREPQDKLKKKYTHTKRPNEASKSMVLSFRSKVDGCEHLVLG